MIQTPGAQYGVKFVLLCISFVKRNMRFGQVVGEDIHLHATSLYFSSAFAGGDVLGRMTNWLDNCF